MSPQEGDEKLPPMPQAEGDDKVKEGNRKKNLNFKQTIKTTSSIITTIKSWK